MSARLSIPPKIPGRCPNCGGTNLTRKGSRRKKFETVQRWQCASCGRGFTPAPPELRAKTYPLRVILDAVTLYNLGHTLAEASARLKTKSGYRVPPSTIGAWIAEHRDLTIYARLRDEGRALFKPSPGARHLEVIAESVPNRTSRPLIKPTKSACHWKHPIYKRFCSCFRF